MIYHLKKLTEESIIHSELYKVEADTLLGAVNKIRNNQVDPYKSEALPETSDFTDFEEIQIIKGVQNPTRYYDQTESLYASDTGYVSSATFNDIDEVLKNSKEEKNEGE